MFSANTNNQEGEGTGPDGLTRNAPYIHDITIHIYVTIVSQKNKTDVCYTINLTYVI